MPRYLSDKFIVLNTILVIMVVFIHSSFNEAAQYPVAPYIQRFIGGGVCRIANCMFFAISGYLFARNLKSLKDIHKKQLKRIRTLVLPYLLWNIIFVAWYIVLEFIPLTSGYSNTGGTLHKIISQPLVETFQWLFLSPAAFQLWFVRDLIAILLFIPLIWLITKLSWKISVLLAIASIVFYPWLSYFWLGFVLAYKNINIQPTSYPQFTILISWFIYILFGIFITVHPLNGDFLHSKFLYFIVNLIGLYAIWGTYDIFSKREIISDKGLWKFICGFSFFIYCFHEPAFNVIKKLSLSAFGTSEISLILLYLVNPFIMVGAAICIAQLLRKITPAIYRILTGGR